MSDEKNAPSEDEPSGSSSLASEGSADDASADGEADRNAEESTEGEASDAEDESAGAKRRNRRGARRELPELADVPPPPPPPRPNYVFLAVASLLFLAADLVTKHLAVKNLEGADRRHVVIKNFFSFTLAHNKGGAWGLLGDQPDHIRLPFFFAISAVAVVFIVSLYRRLEPRQVALKWALPLVLGGALGNLADRVRHQYVVDFIDWYVVIDNKASHWPTFNVADVWIVVGVGLMIVDMFTPRKPVVRAKPSAPRISPRANKSSAQSLETKESAKEEVGAES